MRLNFVRKQRKKVR